MSERKAARECRSELRSLVEAHLADALAHGKSRGTIAYRRLYLRRLLVWLEARGITEARRVRHHILADYVAELRGKQTDYHRNTPASRSVRTMASEVSVLRSLFGWLSERRMLLFDPSEGLRLGNRSSTLPRVILSEREMEALLAAPGTDVLGLRDRAILETLYSTGLRRAELCRLDLYDVDLAGGTVRVRCGKGGRDRVVPIGRCAREAMQIYIREARPSLLSRPKEPALFLAAITRRRLGVKTVNVIVRRHGQRAGIEKPVTPHVLRHTCATHMLQGGADIRHLQLILGHASITTTQIYTRVAAERLLAVHRQHHPRPKLLIP
jgi:integrase/recombinase XerD